GDLRAALVGIDLAAVADAHRHARERRAGKAEDVRVELGRVDDRHLIGAAPAREGGDMARRARALERAHREFGDRRRYLSRPRKPGAFALEAGDVHRPARAIQTANQLDHLALGAARLEARHHDRDRERGRMRHSPNLSKAGATEMLEKPLAVPSARLYSSGRRKRRCREWKRIDVLLMPALEHDELPQAQRVVALAREMLVDELPDERRLEV